MPVISVFLGIIVRMFYQEHEPAHFHAEHQGDHATFTFDGQLVAGGIRSARARRHIQGWARLHRRELEANWVRMAQGQPLERIEPLK
jgi:hypothetical protein